MQGVAASRASDSICRPSGSVPEQPWEQGIQAEAATAGGIQHAAPAPRPDETSAASGSQASLDQVNVSARTIKAEKPKSQNKSVPLQRAKTVSMLTAVAPPENA